jgi:hypothetical protein
MSCMQVVNFSDRTGRHHLLGLDRFADHTGREAWDYSAWVRVYSSYLDERVCAFRWVKCKRCYGATTPACRLPAGTELCVIAWV